MIGFKLPKTDTCSKCDRHLQTVAKPPELELHQRKVEATYKHVMWEMLKLQLKPPNSDTLWPIYTGHVLKAILEFK